MLSIVVYAVLVFTVSSATAAAPQGSIIGHGTLEGHQRTRKRDGAVETMELHRENPRAAHKCTWLKDTDMVAPANNSVHVGANMTQQECCDLCGETDWCAFSVLSGPKGSPPGACWLKAAGAHAFRRPGDVGCCPVGTDCPTALVSKTSSSTSCALSKVDGERCDGLVDDTALVQDALDSCGARGVVIQSGSNCTILPVTLPSDTVLTIEAGGVLQAALRSQWPWKDRYESSRPLIASTHTHNVTITGKGLIDGRGHDWWPRNKIEQILPRPRLVRLTNVTGSIISGIKLVNPAFWCLYVWGFPPFVVPFSFVLCFLLTPLLRSRQNNWWETAPRRWRDHRVSKLGCCAQHR